MRVARDTPTPLKRMKSFQSFIYIDTEERERRESETHRLLPFRIAGGIRSYVYQAPRQAD